MAKFFIGLVTGVVLVFLSFILVFFALLRFREGIGTYLEVLSAESQLLAQESLDVDLRARKLDLSIGLVRALGGGFEPAAQVTSAR